MSGTLSRHRCFRLLTHPAAHHTLLHRCGLSLRFLRRIRPVAVSAGHPVCLQLQEGPELDCPHRRSRPHGPFTLAYLKLSEYIQLGLH